MLKIEHLSKSYHDVTVLQDLSIEIPENKITVILGPSGCGKTTFLNILAGLIKPDAGTISSGNPVKNYEVSYLFQEPRLIPWLTVRDNVGLVLRDKIEACQIAEKVSYSLNAVGIGEYAGYYPSQLSGGLRQRTAFARAFCYNAPILLMDEPFKSLDIKTRYRLIEDFIKLWSENPRTVVMVTHDPKEAVLMGHKLIVFSEKPVNAISERKIDTVHNRRMESEDLMKLDQEILTWLLQ